jgi:hypothetical protein
VDDTCLAGACVGGSPQVCDAGDICTVGEAGGLIFGNDKVTLTWNSVAPIAGPGTVYDLLRGAVNQLPVGSGPSELCLGMNLLSPTATDSELPAANRGFWYLVRGRNSCGEGPYGFMSGGAEEFSSACP